MFYILVLLSHVYAGDALAVIPGKYSDLASCEAAGKVFEDNSGGYRKHICIPGPSYAP